MKRTEKHMMIDIDKLYQSSLNHYPTDHFDDLYVSIKAVGLLAPLTVMEDKYGKYEILSGNRRYAALRKLYGENKIAYGLILCNVVSFDFEGVEVNARELNALKSIIIEDGNLRTRTLKEEDTDKHRLRLVESVILLQSLGFFETGGLFADTSPRKYTASLAGVSEQTLQRYFNTAKSNVLVRFVGEGLITSIESNEIYHLGEDDRDNVLRELGDIESKYRLNQSNADAVALEDARKDAKKVIQKVKDLREEDLSRMRMEKEKARMEREALADENIAGVSCPPSSEEEQREEEEEEEWVEEDAENYPIKLPALPVTDEEDDLPVFAEKKNPSVVFTEEDLAGYGTLLKNDTSLSDSEKSAFYEANDNEARIRILEKAYADTEMVLKWLKANSTVVTDDSRLGKKKQEVFDELEKYLKLRQVYMNTIGKSREE